MRSPSGGVDSQSTAAMGSPSASDLRAKLAKAAEIEAKLSAAAASASSKSSSSSVKKDDSKLTRMSMELCELLSDALLTDPALAARKDAVGRLWRGCFYGRIGELRGRIQKERNRSRRSTGKGDGEAARKHGKAAEEIEVQFRTFLNEAIVLYDFLVDKYREMLFPPGQSQSQASDSAHSQDSSAAPSKGGKKRKGAGKDNQSSSGAGFDIREVPNGVVPTLHKMYIHLGDLHRYARNYGTAESSYALSSRLAPGKGNPYNQLAVVAQLRGDAQQQQSTGGNGKGGGKGGVDAGQPGQQQSPQTAVALYWYARSLQACGDPFPTSRSNLARLFSVNRQWLDKSGGEEAEGSDGKVSAAPLVPGTVEILTSSKAQQERAKALKSAAARKFLAAFVDLHGDLFRGVALRTPSSSAAPSGGAQKRASAGDVALRMRSLLADFSSLLSGPAMAFGDALLCKLVAVNAFACCNDLGPNGTVTTIATTKDGEDRNDSIGEMDPSAALARSFLLAFGAVLAEHATGAAEKLEEKRKEKGGSGSDGGNVPSLRLLLPLALTCEFASSLYVGKESRAMSMEKAEKVMGSCGDAAAAGFLTESQRLFWRNVTATANALRKSDIFLPLMVEYAASMHVDDDDSMASASVASAAIPREFDGLRGFAPFESFLPIHKDGGGKSSDSQGSKKSRKDAFLTPSEAVSALESYQEEVAAAKGNGKGVSGGGNGKNDADNRARVLRLAAFVQRHMGLPDAEEEEEAEAGKFFVRDGETGTLSCAFRDASVEEAVARDGDTSSHFSSGSHGGEHMDTDISAPRENSGSAVAEAIVAENVVPVATEDDAGDDFIDDDDEAGDLLVYKPSTASAAAAPALLLPSDLLLGAGTAAMKAAPVQPGHVAAAPGLLNLAALAAPPAAPQVAALGIGGQQLAPTPLMGMSVASTDKAPPQSMPPKPPPGFLSGLSLGAAPVAALGLPPAAAQQSFGLGGAFGAAASIPAAVAPPPPPPGFGGMGGIVTQPQPPSQYQQHQPPPQPQHHHQPQVPLPFQHHQGPMNGGGVPSWLAGVVEGQQQQQPQPIQGIGGLPAVTANPFASFAQGVGVEQHHQPHQAQAQAPRGYIGTIGGGYHGNGVAEQQAHSSMENIAFGAGGGAGSGSNGLDEMDDPDDLFGLRSLGLLSSDEPRREGAGGGSNNAPNAKDAFASLNLPAETRNPFFAS